jgi:membrane fusion protein, copper/silver efflux system
MNRLRSLIVIGALLGTGFLAGAWATWHFASSSQPAAAARGVLYYTCPMHPQYHADRAGDCPSCGMRLEPVYAGDPTAAAGLALPAGTLKVSAERQQLIGVRVAAAEHAPVQRTIRTVGKVAVDENRVYRVVATTDGIVRGLNLQSTGSFVQREQVLLNFYSSEFLTAQQAYFYALTTLDRISPNPGEITEQVLATNAQLRAAVDGLRNLGMTERQVAELGKARRLTREVELRSPVTGYVLSRGVSPDQRIERGQELYRIADLTHIWIFADLFESDGQYFQPGTLASISLPYREGRIVEARVSNALPQVDPASRTLKVRLETDNPAMSLRPDMFVDVALAITLPGAVTVPVEAVIDSGTRKRVFVDRGSGYFEPRRVETGWRSDDRIEVVKGLMPGERIVVSGSFLLDSESRMNAPANEIASQETDPICGMDVDREKAKAAGRVSLHRGEAYYFCSDQCKRQFDANPEKYRRQGTPQPPRLSSVPAPTAPPPREGAAPAAGRPESDSVAERLRLAERTMNMTAADAGGRTIFATDPVCGAEVDTTAADALKSIFRGKTYYFFSDDCKAEFDRSPEKYVK